MEEARSTGEDRKKVGKKYEGIKERRRRKGGKEKEEKK